MHAGKRSCWVRLFPHRSILATSRRRRRFLSGRNISSISTQRSAVRHCVCVCVYGFEKDKSSSSSHLVSFRLSFPLRERLRMCVRVSLMRNVTLFVLGTYIRAERNDVARRRRRRLYICSLANNEKKKKRDAF